ncbi:MAG TPA: TlpA disulfide reductase family protein, partial [Flavobacteriales bacterium]|nr:TlpA disulfide reductase family protein [Flavobacteriales bacterium]
DTDGNMVSSADQRFRGKPLMVQIMGSWCPNCVDETRLLNELHAKYNDRGLEVLAVAFEKYDDPARAQQALKRYQSTLQVRYPILYGGSASKEEAARKLPFLDHVMSYPTCIFVGRDGKVKRIRTGFYGPGTGRHYEAYKRDLEGYIEGLINEGTATAQIAP